MATTSSEVRWFQAKKRGMVRGKQFYVGHKIALTKSQVAGLTDHEREILGMKSKKAGTSKSSPVQHKEESKTSMFTSRPKTKTSTKKED